MDFELKAEQREIQALARDFAAERIEPHAGDWDREHRFPRELFGALAELGLLGVGTDEQRSRFVPPLARGDHLGSFALTEAEAGSDAGALQTRAEQDGDGWRITGAKQWITNARYAGTILLFARTDPETPGASGVTAFILDGDHVRVTRDEEKLGLNSSITNDIVVEGASVDA